MSFDDTLLSYLPAIVGNAAPVIVTSIPGLRRWNAPVLPSILGAHKTWIGFCSGALIGCIAGGLLHLFGPWTPIAALLYEQLPRKPEVYIYSVWNPAPLETMFPTFYVPIRKYFGMKLQALRIFRSQQIHISYPVLLLIIRNLVDGMKKGTTFAEKFYRIK